VPVSTDPKPIPSTALTSLVEDHLRASTTPTAAIDVGTQLAGAGVCRTVRVASGPVQGARVVPAPTAGV